MLPSSKPVFLAWASTRTRAGDVSLLVACVKRVTSP